MINLQEFILKHTIDEWEFISKHTIDLWECTILSIVLLIWEFLSKQVTDLWECVSHSTHWISSPCIKVANSTQSKKQVNSTHFNSSGIQVQNAAVEFCQQNEHGEILLVHLSGVGWRPTDNIQYPTAAVGPQQPQCHTHQIC